MPLSRPVRATQVAVQSCLPHHTRLPYTPLPTRSFPPDASQHGYSLIELLAVLLMVAVLACTALPAAAALLRQQDAMTIGNRLLEAMLVARSSAISLNRPVAVCASGTPACGKDWAAGITVFVDSNSNALADSGEQVIAQVPALRSGSRIKVSSFGNHNWFRYLPDGQLDNYAAANIVYCPPDGDVRLARTVIISRNGRPRLGSDSNHDGIHENSSGQPLSCS